MMGARFTGKPLISHQIIFFALLRTAEKRTHWQSRSSAKLTLRIDETMLGGELHQFTFTADA
jgi:hypothetical protein